MDVSAEELKQIITDNWGVEVECEYLKKLLEIMPANDKLACVIDSQGNTSRPFKGYMFCTSSQLILIGKGKEKVIPIALIKNISLAKGVAFTVDGSELLIQTEMETVVLSSARNNLMSNFYQILLNKSNQVGTVSNQIVEKDKGGAVLKTVIGVVVALGVLYILACIGNSL